MVIDEEDLPLMLLTVHRRHKGCCTIADGGLVVGEEEVAPTDLLVWSSPVQKEEVHGGGDGHG